MELPSETSYCLAFSEPDHGSDLASVQARGEIAGAEIVVTGRKTWVAHADTAEAALVLCRTEPGAPRYHDLSCVVVPFRENAVEVRPLRNLTGDAELFEVVFDGAQAPLSNVIGGRGTGWSVAMAALGRLHTLRWLESEREFWDVVETARRRGCARDPLVRQQLAWAYCQVQTIRGLVERRPPPDDALINLVWSEYHRRLGEIAVDIVGTDSLLRADGEAYATDRWQRLFLASRGDTIATRTSEVQRTLIAERLLGLPA